MPATIQVEAQTLREAENEHGNVDTHELVMGNASAREAPEELIADGFRMENRVTAGADEIYCGKSAWREWLDDLLIVFAEGTHYSVEIIEARDDYVVASFAIRGYGAHSGRWIDFRWAGVTWFHNGQALRAVTYPSCEDALNAARA